jgi:hypothetical protein
MATVKATVDIQFHPKGEAFSYQVGDTKEEKKSLKTVLAACDRLKEAFDLLLPKAKRKWWTTGLSLTKAEEGHVTVEEIVKKLDAKMKEYDLTRKELAELRDELPGDLFMDGSLDSFPPPYEEGANDDDVVLSFGVTPPPLGGRVYYGHPDGSVTCCFFSTLTMQGEATMVGYKDAVDGRIDVVMATHFEVTSA